MLGKAKQAQKANSLENAYETVMVNPLNLTGLLYLNTHQQQQSTQTNPLMLYSSIYKKEQVAQFNQEAITKLGSPIAQINAISSCTAAARADDTESLDAIVFMAKRAKFMLTNNLWQQVGLCNSARGTVESLLYPEGQKSPNLPIGIMVNFPNYRDTQSPIVFLYHQ